MNRRLSISQVASQLKAKCFEKTEGGLRDEALLSGVSTPDQAREDEFIVIGSKDQLDQAMTTKSKHWVVSDSLYAAITQGEIFSKLPSDLIFYQVQDTYHALAKLTQLFHSPDASFSWGEDFISKQAVVSKTAKVGEGTRIAPFVVIGERARIGKNCVIHPGVSIADDTEVGDECVFFSNVTIYGKSCIGDRVRLHSGVVIGADGFGYAKDGAKPFKIHHIGNVVLEDDVEIGANSAVDRGTFGSTLIRKNVKIDNLCQIGHNVEIGESTVICGQTGIVGSAKIGKGNTVGGMCGIGKIKTGDFAMFAAGTMANSPNIPNGAQMAGRPDRPLKEWMRLNAIISRLPEIYKLFRKLEKRDG